MVHILNDHARVDRSRTKNAPKLTHHKLFGIPKLHRFTADVSGCKASFTARELNWTPLREFQLANSGVGSRIGLHVLRTDRALTVLVSLRPINTKYVQPWCRRAWPMNASCNWVDLFQSVQFSSCVVNTALVKLTSPGGTQLIGSYSRTSAAAPRLKSRLCDVILVSIHAAVWRRCGGRGEGEARRRRGETYRLFHSVCKTLLKMAKGRNYLDKWYVERYFPNTLITGII